MRAGLCFWGGGAALVLLGAGAAFAVGTLGTTATTTTDTGSATSTAANTTAASPTTDSTATNNTSTSPTTDSTATNNTSTSHAVQKFHGDGQKNLGTILVPDDSTISWNCPSCENTNFIIHNASSDDGTIPTNALQALQALRACRRLRRCCPLTTANQARASRSPRR